LNPAQGDLYANRYLASLLAFNQVAVARGETDLARRARDKADETAEALVAWWHRAAERGTLRTFNTSSELDPFIGRGDGISLAIAPHRHKLALFQDLTPEVAAMLREKAPDSVTRVWHAFSELCPTWFLVGEERQLHSGENFLDPPDFALSAFRAKAMLTHFPQGELARRVDLPFCHADLYYLIKVALALEAAPSATK
jgi:hypothetical protein